MNRYRFFARSVSALCLALMASLPLMRAETTVDVVEITKEKIARQAIPFSYHVTHQSDGSVKLLLMLREPYATVAQFDAYELIVLKQRATGELPITFAPSAVARRESSKLKKTAFELKADEIDRAYVTVGFWGKSVSGETKAARLLNKLRAPVRLLAP